MVHNQVTRTGEFALQVMKMGQVTDQERGDDDDGEVWDKEDEELGDCEELWAYAINDSASEQIEIVATQNQKI